MGTGGYEQHMEDIQGQGGYLAVQPGSVFVTDKKQGGMRRMLDWLLMKHLEEQSTILQEHGMGGRRVQVLVQIRSVGQAT